MFDGEIDKNPDLFKGFGIEVKLPHPDTGEFLKIKETLTRIGIVEGKTLYQSCMILHKRKRYVIIHYKELRSFDGKETTITEDDIARRNTIANLLHKWKLLEIINPEAAKSPILEDGVDVIPFKEKNNWNLVQKYQVGGKAIRKSV